MQNPKVTVGISFLNNRNTLRETVQCVFAQTFQDWELLLVDDGSTDGGVDLVRQISDPRVRVFCDGTNKGLPERFREIVGSARGKYIARFDADDLMHPRRLEKQVNVLDEQPEVDVVGTGLLSLGVGDVVKGRRAVLEKTGHAEICASWPIGHVGMCDGSIMGRREWFQKHPYPGNYRRVAYDLALWAYSMHDSTFTNVPEPLYYYRDFETQNFRKYYLTKMAAIRLNRTIDRRHFPWHVCWKAVLCNLMRIGSYALASLFHFESFLVAHRNEPVDPEICEEFARALELIHQVEVPGLS